MCINEYLKLEEYWSELNNKIIEENELRWNIILGQIKSSKRKIKIKKIYGEM
jgi:hypothetical protein